MVRPAYLLFILSIAMLTGGAYSAITFHQETSDARTRVGGFPLGGIHTCIIHHGKEIGSGTLDSGYSGGVHAKGSGDIQVTLGGKNQKVTYNLEIISNALDQLVQFNLNLESSISKLTVKTFRASPISVETKLSTKSRNIEKSFEIPGPVFFQRDKNQIIIRYLADNTSLHTLPQTELAIKYGQDCNVEKKGALIIDSLPIFKFMDKYL